jgi:hypothetical protein
MHLCCKLLVYLLFASLVVSACSLPLAVGMKPSESSTQLATVNGYLNYSATEVQAQQRAELDRLKAMPHDPDALADKFSHGINAYLPDGVKFKVDPSEYWKDPETKLTHHKLAELSEEQLQKMLDVTREHASEVVAYTLNQITGYEGREPPFTIDLDTESPIFQPPRRNFSLAEREIIDEKCDELEESNVCIEIKHSTVCM